MIHDASNHHLGRVYIVYRRENFDRAVADFEHALGIEFVMFEPECMGLRIAISLACGIELISPQGEGTFSAAMHEHLREKGAGISGIVSRVPDLDLAVGAAAWAPTRGLSSIPICACAALMDFA